jgi:hypothetical protein
MSPGKRSRSNTASESDRPEVSLPLARFCVRLVPPFKNAPPMLSPADEAHSKRVQSAANENLVVSTCGIHCRSRVSELKNETRGSGWVHAGKIGGGCRNRTSLRSSRNSGRSSQPLRPAHETRDCQKSSGFLLLFLLQHNSSELNHNPITTSSQYGRTLSLTIPLTVAEFRLQMSSQLYS